MVDRNRPALLRKSASLPPQPLLTPIQGGSFLYVATVISPLSDSDAHGTHQHAHQGMHDEADGQALGQKTRLALLLAGMSGPLMLSMVVNHGH